MIILYSVLSDVINKYKAIRMTTKHNKMDNSVIFNCCDYSVLSDVINKIKGDTNEYKS